MSHSILALDLGTTTGWAMRDADGLIISGTQSFKPGRYDGGGMRYLRFTNWLTEIDRLSGPIAAIWFEEVRRHVDTAVSASDVAVMMALLKLARIKRGTFRPTDKQVRTMRRLVQRFQEANLRDETEVPR